MLVRSTRMLSGKYEAVKYFVMVFLASYATGKVAFTAASQVFASVSVGALPTVCPSTRMVRSATRLSSWFAE